MKKLILVCSATLFCIAQVSQVNPHLTFKMTGPITTNKTGCSTYCYDGDVFSSAWADDDNSYFIADDSLLASPAMNFNLDIGYFTGSPVDGSLTPHLVNGMSEYGLNYSCGGPSPSVCNGWPATGGPANGFASWKASDILSLGGVLYVTLARHYYPVGNGNEYRDNASIISSSDHGVHWNNGFGVTNDLNGAAPVYPNATWPGTEFPSPFFVKYGKDGTAPVSNPDNSSVYIYSVSNDCCWDNGNRVYLARVPRSAIGNLSPSDWQYYTGPIAGDITASANWGTNASKAAITSWPEMHSMTGVQWIDSMKRYVMPSWAFPNKSNYHNTLFFWLEAPSLTGPWTITTRMELSTNLGWYNPQIMTHWIDNPLGSFWLMFTGFYQVSSRAYYCPNWQQVQYMTMPAPMRYTQGTSVVRSNLTTPIPSKKAVLLYDWTQEHGYYIMDQSSTVAPVPTSLDFAIPFWEPDSLLFEGASWSNFNSTYSGQLSDFTAIVVFKANAIIGWEKLIAKGLNTGFVIARHDYDANNIGCAVYDNSSAPYGLYSTSFTDGQWHILTCRRTGSTIDLFRNASNVGSKTTSAAALDNNPLYFGHLPQDNPNQSFFSGNEAFFGLWNRSIGSNELTGIVNTLRDRLKTVGIVPSL